VIDACLATAPAGTAGAERGRLIKDLRGMVEAGVLASPSDCSSRYEAAIVKPYLEHRPFPGDITAQIAARGGITAGSQVLDLAGGPGDLALQLAQHGAEVTLMDWSGAFLSAARRRARANGLPLHTVHESANRLVHDDNSYDVLTISQALHWLDDVRVCRGVLRVLRPGGSFFVVHSAFDVAESHPLAHVLGHDSVLGKKERRPFAREVQDLHDRVQLLLRALDTRGVERIDPTQRAIAMPPVVSSGLGLFRQRRPLGMGFLRGLLTPRHLQAAGLDAAAFWRDAQQRCEAADAAAQLGTHDWALLHFERRAGRAITVKASACPVQSIGFGTPASERC
jgi:SAM-dependent methyltransferase